MKKIKEIENPPRILEDMMYLALVYLKIEKISFVYDTLKYYNKVIYYTNKALKIKNKAKVFIVPSENYDEAVKLKKEYNYDIEIIEADNLHNVIEKLKNR